MNIDASAYAAERVVAPFEDNRLLAAYRIDCIGTKLATCIVLLPFMCSLYYYFATCVYMIIIANLNKTPETRK